MDNEGPEHACPYQNTYLISLNKNSTVDEYICCATLIYVAA
jgi:hypothetical protein